MAKIETRMTFVQVPELRGEKPRTDGAIFKRAAGANGGVIEGYGAVYYDGTERTEYKLWEGAVERIMPGAFDRAIQEDDVRCLFNHDTNNLLGRTSAGTMRLSNDEIGPYYSTDVADTTTGKNVAEHVRRRDVTGSSFSFIVTKEGEEWREEDGKEIREIHSVQLFDVGPVTFPAYEATSADVRECGRLDGALASYQEWRNGTEARGQSVAQRVRELEIKRRVDKLTLDRANKV